MTEPAKPAAPLAHAEVRRYFEESVPAPGWTRDIEALRRATREEALAVRGDLERVAAVEALSIGGVPARLYRPTGAGCPNGCHPDDAAGNVLIWVHGGGWMHGDLDCYEGVARALANRARCAVLAVAYRLAPEHPFPAGFDDVWAAVEWSAGRFGQVAVAGDSSGGNLAAAAALKARDRQVDIAAQVLVYPVLESHMNSRYKRAFRTRYAGFLNQPEYGTVTFDRISYIWDTYVPGPRLRDCPYVSPLRADRLRGVAPAVIITAEHDILRPEAQEYAQRLRNEDVRVTYREYPGQVHGFFQMRGVMSDAQDAMSVAASHVNHEFTRRDVPRDPARKQ
ncbi:MAG TPA: alpha/beta hydrolase [Trebonia sp.]